MASPTSAASPSPQQSRPSSQHGEQSGAEAVPVETLVQHLLDAKRSLSTMTLVLRANEFVTAARHAHEESVILEASAQFLRRGIRDQVQLLGRARRNMNRTYDNGKRNFKQVVKTLDKTNDQLENTMNILRGRMVESAFRPTGEGKRNLLDFVDVAQVETMRNALKENIAALQATQTSFDGDLLRLDDDLRGLNKTLNSTPFLASPSASNSSPPIEHLLSSMVVSSHEMAELLTSLTKHFDLCVTAVRTTEGGAALAMRKAAEVTESQGGDVVSISGVIAEQESHMDEIEPLSTQDRDQMLHVVVQDASLVVGVVQELNEKLRIIEDKFGRVKEQTIHVRNAYLTALEAFHMLEDIGSRLQSYIAAEREFCVRWDEEYKTIDEKMEEMDVLRAFYQHYASSYDHVILEAERRRVQEERVLNIWRKAKDSVEKIVEADRRQRETFRQEIAEYIPTDLWPGMDDGMRRYEVVPAQDEPGGAGSGSTPALDRSVVDAALMRLGQQS